MKKVALFAAGLGLVIAGMTLTLSQWDILAQMVKACAGPVLAVAGLVILFSVSTILLRKNNRT